MQWNWYGFNLKIVLLAFVAGIFILFGGQWVYKSFGYNQPLIHALQEDASVQSVEIDDSSPVFRIVVHLKRTDNLMETYRALDRQVESAVGPQYQLVIEDERDAKLEEAYYDSQPAIYQAIMQGNFQDMKAVVEENAREAGAEARVFIDQDYVYLQMDGTDHYLAAVIPRDQSSKQFPAGSGGGFNV